MVQQCNSPKPPRWRPFHRLGKLRRKGSAPNPSTLSSNRTCTISNDGVSLNEQGSTEATFIEKQPRCSYKTYDNMDNTNHETTQSVEVMGEQKTPKASDTLRVASDHVFPGQQNWIQHGEAATVATGNVEDDSFAKAISEYRDPPIGMDDESSLIPKLQFVAELLTKSPSVIAGAEVEIDSIANYVDADVLASPYKLTTTEEGKRGESQAVAVPSEVVCRGVNSMDDLSLNSADFDAPSCKVELPPSMRPRAKKKVANELSSARSLEDNSRSPTEMRSDKPKAQRLAHRLNTKWSRRSFPRDSERSQRNEAENESQIVLEDETRDHLDEQKSTDSEDSAPHNSNIVTPSHESDSMLREIGRRNIDSPNAIQRIQQKRSNYLTPSVTITNDGTEIKCANGNLQVQKTGKMVQIQVTDSKSPSGTKRIELPLKVLESVEASIRNKASSRRILRVDSMGGDSSIFSNETQIAKTARTFTEECPVFVDLLLNFNQCMTSFGQALHMCKDDNVPDDEQEDAKSLESEADVVDEINGDLVVRSFDADETTAMMTVDNQHVDLLRSYSDALAEIAKSVKVMAEAEAVRS